MTSATQDLSNLIAEVEEARGLFNPEFYYNQEDFMRDVIGRYLTDRVVQGFQPDKWQGKTVVFFPRHLSQLDPYPLGLSIYEQAKEAELNMGPPSFLAGSNLMWGSFGEYIKKMKAIPIRRNRMKQGDPYRAAFCEEITRLMAKGKHIIIFPEAGRSDDGNLRQFKKTFVHCASDAQERSDRDILIQPVSIVYDFVPETLHHHWLNRSRKLMSFQKAVGSVFYYGLDLRIFAQPYLFPNPTGKIYINFGEPRTIRSLRISHDTLEEEVKFEQHVTDYIAGQIIEMQAIPPTALVAHCMQAMGTSRISHTRLRHNVAREMSYLKNHGFNTVAFADLGLEAVDYALDLLEAKKIARRKRKSGLIHVRKPKAVKYCANTIAAQIKSLRTIMSEFRPPQDYGKSIYD